MENQDYEEIRGRLAKLRAQIADFQGRDHTHWRSIEFDRWQRGVLRCMDLAGPYAAGGIAAFINRMNPQRLDWHSEEEYLKINGSGAWHMPKIGSAT